MFQLLKNSLVKDAVEEDDDGIKDLVELVLKKLDEDRDGRVSEADWASAIGKEGLMMEALGQCLPFNDAVKSFLMASEEDILVSEKLKLKQKSKLVVKQVQAIAV